MSAKIHEQQTFDITLYETKPSNPVLEKWRQQPFCYKPGLVKILSNSFRQVTERLIHNQLPHKTFHGNSYNRCSNRLASEHVGDFPHLLPVKAFFTLKSLTYKYSEDCVWNLKDALGIQEMLFHLSHRGHNLLSDFIESARSYPLFQYLCMSNRTIM